VRLEKWARFENIVVFLLPQKAKSEKLSSLTFRIKDEEQFKSFLILV
jgi:hypothetical protein